MIFMTVSTAGKVGKSTLADIISSQMGDCKLIRIESINNTGNGSEKKIRAEQFGAVVEALPLLDDAVIDVGSSNVESLVELLTQYAGSCDLFDRFVVPVIGKESQIADTITTVEILHKIGVSPKKIRVVLNQVGPKDVIDHQFSDLFEYAKEGKCLIDPSVKLSLNEIYDRLRASNESIKTILSDDTDYKAAAKAAKKATERTQLLRKFSLKMLATGAARAHHELFAALSGEPANA